MERWFVLRSCVLCFLGFVAIVVWWPEWSASAENESYLIVRFLDVGQGDAIHVTSPDGVELLIDGGSTSGVLRELASGRSFFDRDLDVMIATHPDTDHVAGLVDVLQRFAVGMIIESGALGDGMAAQAFASAAVAEGAVLVEAQAGQVITLGASTTVRILSPYGDTSNWETNRASVIVQVVYGDTEFMFTGDAPSGIEEYLVDTYGTGLRSDVLKLGHHGSKTSSSEAFLQVVQPEYAVVSAGADNRYGHPAAEVVARASDAGARIVSTAEQGTLTFKSDGTSVWME
jgi:competence protein ComEC